MGQKMGETIDLDNPLPIHDSKSELQRQSFHALYAITAGAQVLVRDERFMDYGVDASLEVLADGRATNFRSQVQIKSAACADLNQDGTVSKAIDVANLNYLLNGPSPLYLFYSAGQKRFWYAWAFDELRRLEVENPEWRGQKTVTVRFSKELTDTAIHEIRSRITRESMAHRDVVDALARCALEEEARFAIDQRALAVQTGEGAYRLLSKHGFALVSRGHAQQALDQADLLAARHRRRPAIQMVIAYAHYILGQYLLSLGACAHARLRNAELGASDREILGILTDGCEFQIGKITRDEYARRRAAAALRPGASLQCRIEALRFQVLAERDERARARMLGEFRTLVAQAIADSSNSDALKVQMRIHLAYVEGCHNHSALAQSVGMLCIQKVLKQPWASPDPRPVAKAAADLMGWASRMADLVREAQKTGIPWLHAYARLTSLFVRESLLGFQRFQRKFLGVGTGPERSEVEGMLSEAKAIADEFAATGNLEGELRAKLVAADIHEIADDIAAAKGVAAEVRPVAEALELADFQEKAQQHLTGETILQRMEAGIRRDQEGDRDYQMAAMSESDVDYYAHACFEVSQLPLERLPMVRRDIEGLRMIANERLHWCRHIEQWQALMHTMHPRTAYATPTRWVGKCVRHNYESLQDGEDMHLVISRFKEAYCDDCSDREPKAR